MRSEPDKVRFDRMIPIVKEPFSPDDDGVVATNAMEMLFFLERSHMPFLIRTRLPAHDKQLHPHAKYLTHVRKYLAQGIGAIR